MRLRERSRPTRRLLAILAVAIVGLLAVPAAALAVCDVCGLLMSPASGSAIATGNTTLDATYFSNYGQGDLRLRICPSGGGSCSSSPDYERSWTGLGIWNGSSGYSEAVSTSWNFPAGVWRIEFYASYVDFFGGTVDSTTAFTLTACDPGTCPPSTSTLVYPASGGQEVAQPTLLATYEDPDVGDSGHVDFQVCTTSTCSTVVTSGSSASNLPRGAMGSWQVDVPLTAETTYYWRARGVDASATAGSWSSARSVTPKTNTARLRPNGIVSDWSHSASSAATARRSARRRRAMSAGTPTP